MTNRTMTTHPISKVLPPLLDRPGVMPQTKQRAHFWLNALLSNKNYLGRRGILATLRAIKFQAELEHTTYGHKV